MPTSQYLMANGVGWLMRNMLKPSSVASGAAARRPAQKATVFQSVPLLSAPMLTVLVVLPFA